MDKHTLKLLEFEKVIDQIKDRTTSYLGKFVLDNLKPSTNIDFIKERQREVTAAKEMIIRTDEPPFGGIRDIRQALVKADKGAVLEPEELLDIKSTLYAARRLSGYFKEQDEETEGFEPVLKIGKQLKVFPELENEIGRCIGDYGEVLDKASQKLRQLRLNIKKTENRIRDKLDSIINDRRYHRLLQEGIVTIRENRFVVPVKSEAKNSFPGIVHDRSASGQTVFIEPMPVVRLNNELKELKSEEKKEIYRILKMLSGKVQVHFEDLTHTLQVMAYLDALFAKAKYSLDFSCSEPLLNDRKKIRLLGARHPLIPGDKVVPIDIEIGWNFKSLVITGPNTGGKTVSLKTIGLLTLMAQSGLHIPALSGSEVGVFKNIFADIGDEQSIEQNLSTFSSHISRIVRIISETCGEELILLDELGAGTDPQEGSALAMSIIEYLHEKDARTVATTHYSELKAFAYSRAEIENASVEFDLETLSPTYKLVIGIPGRSNAFEIAGRLGLKDDIINTARSRLDRKENRVDSMIRNIEDKQQDLEQIKKRLGEEKERSEELRLKYEELLKSLENRKEKIIQEAYSKAKEIVKKAKIETRNLIQEIREKQSGNPDRLLQKVNTKIKGMESEINTGIQPVNKVSFEKVDPEKIKAGDWVYVQSLNQKGEIVDIDRDKEEVRVKAGMITITVSARELYEAEPEKDNKKSENLVSQVRTAKTSSVSSSLDLRGMRYEEAQQKVDKYLDDAYLAGLSKVEIIHGKGTGALRSGVHQLLKEHYQVEDFRLGSYKEGGSGVTIVKLKQ